MRKLFFINTFKRDRNLEQFLRDNTIDKGEFILEVVPFVDNNLMPYLDVHIRPLGKSGDNLTHYFIIKNNQLK